MLQQEGLEQFYDLKGGQNLPPVSPQAMRQQDYGWLEASTFAAEAQRADQNVAAELSVSIQGLSCMACIWFECNLSAFLASQPLTLYCTGPA